MSKPLIDFNQFSPHLFRDVEREKLSMEEHKEFIVGRVPDYGLMADWELLQDHPGIRKIAEIATNIRDLDPRSLSFISEISKIPKEKFRCYTMSQSIPPHWNF